MENAIQDEEELKAQEDPSEELILTSPLELEEENLLEGPLPSQSSESKEERSSYGR